MSKTGFTPLEDGEYLVRINRVTEAATSKGDPMLKVSYQVIHKVGDKENVSKTKDRLIFENFLLKNSNPKVKEITEDRINRLLQAVGQEKGLAGVGGDVGEISNYTELPFIATIGTRIDKKGVYAPSNYVKLFKRR